MTFPAARLAALAERTAKTVLERCERHSDYPFIDLKYQVAGRREVSAADPWYARRDIIYSWIQGRGLEVLGQYALRDASARGRCRKVLAGIVANLEGLRAGNGGRMHFMMTADGRFLTVGDAGEALPAPPAGAVNYSDLFYLK